MVIEALRTQSHAPAGRADTGGKSGASSAEIDVLSMVGHELRNPLSVISTALFVMERRGHAEDAPQRRVIADQLEALRSLCRQLTDAARIHRSLTTLATRTVPLRDVMQAALDSTASLFAERRHHLRSSLPAGVQCEADPIRLAQCFANLLANAAHYTDPGGEVDFRGVASADGRYCEVQVCDNGRGIPAPVLPHVFDLYFRAQPSEGQGLGIGLALVKQVVELHHGEVWADSDGAGCGARFHIRLPTVPGRTTPAITG